MLNIRGRILELAAQLSWEQAISIAAEIINQSGLGATRQTVKRFELGLDPVNQDAFRQRYYDEFLD